MGLVHLIEKVATPRETIEPNKLAKKDRYPYGTNIHFETDLIQKLGMSPVTSKVGDIVPIQGKGKITSISQNDSEGGSSRNNISIQLTHLDKIATPRS